MDSMYFDVFPADDSESSSDEDNECVPSLEVPCARCKDRKQLCKRCKRRQQISSAGARKSSLEKACFPPRATSSDAPAAVPEVLLPPLEDEAPTPRNGAAAPVYAAMYTASPSWMSTYTSSTCATTYTAAHERSQPERAPLLEVAGQTRRRMQPRRPRMNERRRPSGWQTSEVEGWDEREIEGGGSYWDVEGARWEEQRIRTPERRAQKRVWQNERALRAPVVKGAGRRRKWDEQKGELRWRSRPLVEPLTPRYLYDVLVVQRARLLEMAFISGKGHSRVVFGMAYARGTGHARGLFCLPAPKYEPSGDGSGFMWREGIWTGLFGWLWGTERGPAIDVRDID
ncbi:hypothetical protein CGLO_05469 [Colletotrichum gloeosporioides Cg-14]|uniref:Uncharacterized protein n=1 Tax=Colletotrichum gloeosporioides (strain Cg-14) TaxID=1237896 RepID=T0KRG3_COLGC|nr:hypothetical protein CGLO_05469 [Colletotrichum gloeosporioides Cg-14]